MTDRDRVRIFQIGFNKCGTRSLFHFFKNNGIKSVHYDGGNIAKTFFNRDKENKRLIGPKYKDTVFFSDMEWVFCDEPLYVPQKLFKKLASQYPNSYFILNTRCKQKWLKSRILHGKGSYLKKIADKAGKSEKEIIEIWGNEWVQHHDDVKKFFKNQPGRLIVFDIENDNIYKLVRFFSHLWELDARYYKHLGKTKTS